MKKILILLLGLLPALTGAQTFREMMQNPEAYNFYEIQTAAEAHFAAEGTGQGTGYNQYMRWAMFNEPRAYPSGELYNWNDRNIQAYRDYVESDYFSNLPTAKTHNGYWQSLGPTNWTNQGSNSAGNGRINTMAFHPTNSSIMWAGSALGGLWKTVDAGLNWTPLTDGMPNLGVSGIAVNPDNPDIIYILTGDGDGTNSATTGVLKTTNGGVTWKTTGLVFTSNDFGSGSQTNQPRYTVRGFKLIINPDNPNVLFAATTEGIRRTTDGGNTWTTVLSGDFRDVAFRPGVSNTIYAVTTLSFRRSTDGGNTWTTISSGLPNSDFSRIAIGVTPDNSQVVYLLYGGGSTGFRGLYRSTNTGTSFTLRSNSPNIFSGTQDGSDTGHQAGYDIAIAVSPTDENMVYMGGINVWKSANGGSTWTIMSNWRADSAPAGQYCHADIHFLAARSGIFTTTLWAGNDGGVFRSGNPTSTSPTWENRSNGLVIMQFYQICTGENVWYGGTQDAGTNRLNSGSSVATAVRGADGFECAVTPTVIFSTTQGGLGKRSVFSTGEWEDITPPGVSSPWNVDFLIRPGTTTTLFYGGTSGNIHRSTNSGDTWSNLGGGLTGRIFNLAIGTSNTNRLYFANVSSIRRTDNANAPAADVTFTSITTGLPNLAITGIAVDPENSNNVFVCLSGYSGGQKVYRSTNAGASWTNLSGTLPNVPIHCIVHEGANEGLYIGTDIGVFYRNNSTGGWLPFMNGLPTTIVSELEIRPGEGRIYAGTFGRGLWRSELFSNCSANLTLIASNDPSNPAYTGYQYYTASNTITSSRTITGGVGTDVTYRAGGSVTLNEGFEVRAENEFRAELGSCNSVFQPIVPTAQGILEVFADRNDGTAQAHTLNTAISYDALHRIPTRVYPNPFGVSFTLEVAAFNNDRTVRGELFDLSGKLVKTISPQSVPQGLRLVSEIYTDDLPAGVYVMRVYEDEDVETFKVVKQ
jgi:hypothetical protein